MNDLIYKPEDWKVFKVNLEVCLPNNSNFAHRPFAYGVSVLLIALVILIIKLVYFIVT